MGWQLYLTFAAAVTAAVGVWAIQPAQARPTGGGGSHAELPRDVENMFRCSVRCASLAGAELQGVEGELDSACEGTGNVNLCAMTPEQFCAASCGGGQRDMSNWLPKAFGKSSHRVVDGGLPVMRQAFQDHQRCAERCAQEGVAVDAKAPGAATRAADVLGRCGVVQLVGAFEASLFDRVLSAIGKLRKHKAKHDALLDTVQLHDGRYQLYLPYTAPFDSRHALGVNDLVLDVLERYFQSTDFGIDHVSVLTSSSPNANQSLHPDVAGSKRLQMSVHTALLDISSDMGPTFFCPCTGEEGKGVAWAAAASIKMAALKRKDCLAASFVPEFTKRGTVSIYDGATFHKGLANGSGRNRDVLKLELGFADFPYVRQYTESAPAKARAHTDRFRKAFGPPRLGSGGGHGEGSSRRADL